jgi:hypothetical protein
MELSHEANQTYSWYRKTASVSESSTMIGTSESVRARAWQSASLQLALWPFRRTEQSMAMP